MDTSFLDERTLAMGDEGVHVRCKSFGKMSSTSSFFLKKFDIRTVPSARCRILMLSSSSIDTIMEE